MCSLLVGKRRVLEVLGESRAGNEVKLLVDTLSQQVIDAFFLLYKRHQDFLNLQKLSSMSFTEMHVYFFSLLKEDNRAIWHFEEVATYNTNSRY